MNRKCLCAARWCRNLLKRGFTLSGVPDGRLVSSRGPVKMDDLESLSCWEELIKEKLADAGEQATERLGRRCPLIRGDAGGCSDLLKISVVLVLPALPMEQEVEAVGESCRVG